MSQVCSGIDDYIAFLAFGICVSVDADPVGACKFGGYVIIVQMDLVVSGLCNFSFMRECRPV